MKDRTLHLLRRTQLLRLLPVTAERTIGGHRWRLPLSHHAGWALLHDDMPWMSGVLRRTLPLFPGTVVEGNASNGHFLLHVKAADPGRKVMLFAPQQACRDHLAHLVRANRLNDVQIHPGVLAEAPETSTLYTFADAGCDGTATLEPAWKFGFPASRSVPTRTFSLDSFMAPAEQGHMDPPGLVRIHVRGAEARVLEGMTHVLRTFHPLLFLQWPPVFRSGPPEHLHLQEAAEKLLREHDYVLLRIRYEEVPMALEAITGPIGLQPDHGQCAHLAVHRSRVEEVRAAFETGTAS